MDTHEKTKDGLIKELQELQQEYNSLKALYGKDTIRHHQAEQELILANKELAFQNEEKEKRAAELVIANKELAFQNDEKEKRAAELIIANKELLFQNEEKEKRATELNENKTLLASVLDSSLSGIMAFKSIRNAEGAIMDFEWQLVNAAAEQMVSHSQTEILGKRLLEEMPGNRVEGIFDLYVQVVETGIPLSHEHYYEHEKVKTWFHTIAIKRLDGFVVTFSNITERKLAEQELIIANKELLFQNEEKEKRAAELVIAKERAEQSDRLKSAFLANMSHEIRTPMNGILGFASILKEADLTGEEQREYLELMEQSGVRMLNIINDIVDISKIESGLMEIHLKESNINEQIDYIHTFFKPEMDNKRIQFFAKKSLTGKEAVIITDREKLYAILTNLVKNAIKYTDEGSIEFGYNLKTESQTTVLEFFIRDTGIGIPKHRQEPIFERFIQADIANKMAQQGAGLGLSISKAFVKLLGGKIWVSSEEGKGSTFYFTLPYNTEPEEKNVVRKVVLTEGVENPINPEVSGLKILIVEDDETSGKLISITINKLSKEVIQARTGNEAVEICRKNPEIDLILMDIQMPDMNGYEATRQIRQFNNDVVIIAQTVFGLSGDREKAIEAGCNDYIAKPINKAELLSLVQKYFKK